MSSPTQRTRDRLKRLGYTVATVEAFIRPPAGKPFKRDLFGLFDLLAVREDEIIGVQVTDTTNVSKRIAKAQTKVDFLRKWITAGAAFEVWGWKTKKTKTDWTHRVVRLGPDGEPIIDTRR